MLIMKMTSGEITPKKVTVLGNKILPLMTKIISTVARPEAEA